MLDDRYEIKKKIDEGTYAKVYLAQDWLNADSKVVLKILRSRAFVKPRDKEQVHKEIQNHSLMDHKNVLRMLGHSYTGVMHLKGLVDKSQTYVYLVTEFLGSNFLNMFDLIEHSGGKGFGEDAGRFFLSQLLDALEYIHNEVSVVHRDLKPENILIDGDMTFKLIDFGLSESGDLSQVKGAVGSPSYVAPEVLEQKVYDGRKADVFSMGVLLFIIVMGKFPHGNKVLTDKYYTMIRNKQYDTYFTTVDATKRSQGFKDLIVRLMAYDSKERPSVDEIRASDFFTCPDYCAKRTKALLKSKTMEILAAKASQKK